jgi:lipoprotein signal peptidase
VAEGGGDSLRTRLSLVLAISATVFAIDQASKLVAAAVQPANYVLNPRTPPLLGTLAVLATMLLVLTLSFRPALAAAAVWMGGAAGNLVDAYAWPGGVPDFVRVSWIWGTWNLADAFIAVGAFALGMSLVVWLVLGGVRPSDARAQVAE